MQHNLKAFIKEFVSHSSRVNFFFFQVKRAPLYYSLNGVSGCSNIGVQGRVSPVASVT